jgi:hypothetical protein
MSKHAMFKPPHPFSLDVSPELMIPTRVGAKRLLIADDHAMLREGLALMVQAQWPSAGRQRAAPRVGF